MLLETFTRRKPNEFEGDLSLKQWVSYSFPETIMDVVDAHLVTSTGNRSQKELDVVASILKVALDCCVESPSRRTNMKDVVGMLQKIKIQLLYSSTVLAIIYATMEKAFTSFLLTSLLLHYVMASSAMTKTNVTTDQLALFSLKSQIASDPFHFLEESWSFATSICHLVGVTCGSRHKRGNSLNLSNMALTGKIPCDLGNLTFLVSLDLGSNNFHGNLPQEMTHLRRLKFLDLSFNSFRGEIPSWFGFLYQLQVLNIGNNSFTGPIPSSFSNISKLEILNMKYNSIEGQTPKVIGSLLNLRELNLRGNKLIGSIPLSLSNASRFETLEISHNSLQGNIPEGIGNLHNMKVLSVQ
ncbi:hypothetical protein T459_32524 [Capsicum annuum]|uniref:Leucine-rich repeat-containing N-terminal plant-type domain-containing protein n=2 Tax=Capsicum annuum TaxID=4072 RepID=A0A2G2Y1J7_CAPAN|nr:putative LRR receptor-like serine/threonine-protein kinase-like [Capsicum annuum]PHT63589.1 hypothetical protein T459_32524 [Capsicum annuum]